jgi:hypothetical protein
MTMMARLRQSPDNFRNVLGSLKAVADSNIAKLETHKYRATHKHKDTQHGYRDAPYETDNYEGPDYRPYGPGEKPYGPHDQYGYQAPPSNATFTSLSVLRIRNESPLTGMIRTSSIGKAVHNELLVAVHVV